MSNIFYNNVTREGMALSAAMAGDRALFTAIWDIGQCEAEVIERFKSLADEHIHDTFFLLHEMVLRGYDALLKDLVLAYHFSPYKMEIFLEEINKEKLRRREEDEATKARGERVALIADDAYWWLLESNPYGSKTLLQLAEATIDECNKRIKGLSQERRRATLAIKGRDKIIRGRAADPQKLSRYREELFMNCGGVIRSTKKFRRVPLYDAVLDKDRFLKHIELCIQEQEVTKEKLGGVIKCREFLLTLPAYESNQ